MRKIVIMIIFVFALSACENQENVFPDFNFTAAYFPYQYPVRTLILGDYIYDNSNDNEHRFLISAGFGGVYANTKDRVLNIQVDESLCKNVRFGSTSNAVQPMPSNYYTLSSSDKLTIPAGKFNGSIAVQLSEEFFNDPSAIQLNYVIPLRIVGSNDVDSILRGKPAVNNPDPRISSHWDVVPRDFTLFAVKFVNPYHGTYFHRGKSILKDAANNILETNIYRTRHIVDNELWSLGTSGKNQVTVKGNIHSSSITGELNLVLDFADNGECTVKEGKDAVHAITGTGKFVKDGDTWGDKKRNAIYLNYQFTDGVNTYSATDTLVIRDRGIVMEVFEPAVFD